MKFSEILRYKRITQSRPDDETSKLINKKIRTRYLVDFTVLLDEAVDIKVRDLFQAM